MANKESVEKKLKYGEFTIKVGSTDRKNPRVIYFEGTTYVSPEYDSNEFISDMNRIEKFARKKVMESLRIFNSPFKQDYIATFNSSSERMKKGKYSNLQFEYYLIQPYDKLLSVSDILKLYKESFLKPFVELEKELIDNNFTICNKKPKLTK
jgi:hypothetical protein